MATVDQPMTPRALAVRSLPARLAQWHYILAIVTIGLAIWAATTSPAFASANNLSQLAAGMGERALVILPLALVIIVREIDLSVASMIGLGSVSMGVLLQAGVPLWLAIGATVVVGAAAGAFNGLFVALLGLPSMVVTLGTLALYRGICYIVLGSESISTFPDSLINFGYGSLPGTKVPLLILPFLVLAVVYAVILHRTSTGRRILAAGGNPGTALYSGIDLKSLKMWLFVTTGVVCAVAGVLYTARLSSSRADNAFGMELDIITIVFLGGVSVLGGKGNIAGVVWAAGLVALARNVMGLDGVSGAAQGTVIGLLLIISLLLTNTVGGVLSRRSQRSLGRRSLHSAAAVD